jgi:uroporphyrinogen decarboxylase
MNKRDSLMRLLDPAYRPDSVPAAFFQHFDPAFHRGQAAVDKHLEFYRYTGMDFVKIQLEHPMPRFEVKAPKDWAKVPSLDKAFWQEALAVVKGVVDAASSEAVVIQTLYSPFMLSCQFADMETVSRHIKDEPEAFRKGIEILTEGLQVFVRECIALGLDGFYASTQGAESGRFTDPTSFETCVRPYDLAIMDEIEKSCPFSILHVCDYHLPYADLGPFKAYPGQVANTPLRLVGKEMSAKEAAALFGRPFMGGMERTGVMTGKDPQAIRKEVIEVLDKAPERFVLGADCTIPPTTPWENIKVAIQTAHEYRR